MKKTLQIIIILVLSVIMLFGCTQNDVEIPEWSSSEAYRFAAYISPPPEGVGEGALVNNPNHITVEDYTIMKEGGFDYAYSGVYRSDADLIETLRVMDEVGGIKFLIRDYPSINVMIYDTSAVKNWDGYKQAVIDKFAIFTEYDSFAGVMAIDEPNAIYFNNIKEVRDWYIEQFPALEFNMNLLPNWAPGGLLGTDSYEEHLSEYMRIVEPNHISYDYYPFVEEYGKQAHFRTGYFSNLESIAEIARDKGVPFYNYLQTMAHLSYTEMTHYSDVAWQVYTAMAFGCKGAQTFTYWPTPISENTTAVVDSYGRPTACYYAMQQVIEEVRFFEQVYMNFAWQNIMVVQHDEDIRNFQLSAISNPIEEHDRIASVSTSEDIIIGAFKDSDNRDGFMFTNTTLPQKELTAAITVKFNDATKALIFAKGKKIIRNLNNGVLELQVGPGEGWFVIPL